jgi:hypothetical protein
MRGREPRFVDWRYLGKIANVDETWRMGAAGSIRIVTQRRRYVLVEGGVRFELTARRPTPPKRACCARAPRPPRCGRGPDAG